MPMMIEIKHPTLPVTVMFEDDGRTGYAYLIRDPGGIVADVWIYNVVDTPDVNDWNDLSLAPFRNSKSYSKKIRPFQLPSQLSDVEMDWSSTDDGRAGGSIFICGILVAALFEGDQPGRSLMASRDGPVARVLE